MLTKLKLPLTATGRADAVTAPLPSWPASPAPQQNAAPLGVRAQLCWPPAEILANCWLPVTATAPRRDVNVPSPSWPLVPLPQQ
jgi:hypothetical protein